MRSYVTPVAIGEKMRGGVIARVIASKTPKVKEGDIVTASIGWTELSIVGENEFQKFEVPKGGKITDLLGVLGTFLHAPPCLCLYETGFYLWNYDINCRDVVYINLRH